MYVISNLLSLMINYADILSTLEVISNLRVHVPGEEGPPSRYHDAPIKPLSPHPKSNSEHYRFAH